MPSLKKLLASAVLFASAYGAVVHQAEEAADLSKRDIFVTIKTHGGTSASACQLVDCFKQCEADGALGGVCDDADTCQCAYGTEPFRVQHSRVKGHTIAHGAEKTCDLDICSAVCYQKGGYTGGVCVDNACQCVKPTDAVSRPEKAKDSPISADGVECHNYSE
ncbi:MAG: hypothetical protein L6R36_009246 [Xanthoria steineri]|nr:MAG: hypothetical protein L6R36_009246 [Xanthoria steineri]